MHSYLHESICTFVPEIFAIETNRGKRTIGFRRLLKILYSCRSGGSYRAKERRAVKFSFDEKKSESKRCASASSTHVGVFLLI